MKITKEKFNEIKIVTNSLPRGKRGNGEVYAALGYSDGTVSLIRQSSDYEDYKALTKVKTMKAREAKYGPSKEVSTRVPTMPTTDKTLERIESKIDDVLTLMVQPKILPTDDSTVDKIRRSLGMRA